MELLLAINGQSEFFINTSGRTFHFVYVFQFPLRVLNSNLSRVLEEHHLVDGLRSHNRGHYEYLYDNYGGALFGHILSIVRKQAVAEEVLQDTFVKIWDKIDSYDSDKGRLFTWMVNIAKNLSVDRLRSREMSNARKTFGIEPLVGQVDESNKSEMRIDDIGVKDLLQRLPLEQGKVVEYIYFFGYTQLEFSQEFNIPIGTVKTRLSLGLKKLHTLML